jgi:peptidyl-prolyl cis-trans isomerase A (cyclophilin A)
MKLTFNSTSGISEELSIMRFAKLAFNASTAVVLISTLGGLCFAQAPATAPAAATKPKTSTSTAAKPAPTAKPATTAPTYDRALLKPATLKDQAPETYQVKFDTSRGEFTITVTRAWAPLGADRFFNLVKHHYFDNAHFFRVIPNFVAQFGISAYPPVAAVWEKATIKDDSHSQSNKKGTIVFATAGPNTRTTQLFINLKDNPSLDSQGFTPFGVVDGDGMKVVNMFYDQYGGDLDQEAITKGGKKYIETKYPKLDIIKSAALIGTAATAAPTKPAATTKPAPTTKPATKPATTTPKPQ